MWRRHLSNVIGFDDAPFEREWRGNVALVGTVCSGTRLDVVVRGYVKRDGNDATEVMETLVRDKSLVHVRGVMMQGITTAGFNVIDIHALADRLELPVLVVMRKKPKLQQFFDALAKVPGAKKKRETIEAAGEPEALGTLWVQRAGLTADEAARMLERTTLHGAIPEPLRLAHIIAGGMTRGKSTGRA
jgi:endonuclease V-like protein UPF0215 family